MILTCQKPCVEARCEYCREGDGEDGYPYHYPSKDECVQGLVDLEWRIILGAEGVILSIICPSCWNEVLTEEQKAIELAKNEQ